MKNTKLVKSIHINLKENVINVRLSERKDHFIVIIPKVERERLKISIGDISIINFNNNELVRPVRADAAVSLPKRLLKDRQHDDWIELCVEKAISRDSCLNRPNKPFLNNKLDIRYFIAEKTDHNYPLYIIPRDEHTSTIWYPVGGGVRHITIYNLVHIEKIAEFLGFYFGDGTKCKNMQSLRMTNCEPSILVHSLNVLGEMGIDRKLCKVQIIYSTPQEITENIKQCCVRFWSKILQLDKKRIVSVNGAYNVRETRKHGSARICINSSVLFQIMVRNLLLGVIKRIVKPQDEIDYKLLKGFMRGLLAAEGFPELNNYGSLVKVGIAFNPYSNELNLYRKLLDNLNINYGKTHGNSLYVYQHKNMRKFNEFNAFRLHKTRNEKFLAGYNNNFKLGF